MELDDNMDGPTYVEVGAGVSSDDHPEPERDELLQEKYVKVPEEADVSESKSGTETVLSERKTEVSADPEKTLLNGTREIIDTEEELMNETEVLEKSEIEDNQTVALDNLKINNIKISSVTGVDNDENEPAKESEISVSSEDVPEVIGYKVNTEDGESAEGILVLEKIDERNDSVKGQNSKQELQVDSSMPLVSSEHETNEKDVETKGYEDQCKDNDENEDEKQVTNENHGDAVNNPNSDEVKVDNSVLSESSESETIQKDTKANRKIEEYRDTERQQNKDQNENEEEVEEETEESYGDLVNRQHNEELKVDNTEIVPSESSECETIHKDTEAKGITDEDRDTEIQKNKDLNEDDEDVKKVTNGNHRDPINTPNIEELKVDNSVPSESSKCETILKETEAKGFTDEDRGTEIQQNEGQIENDKVEKEVIDENYEEPVNMTNIEELQVDKSVPSESSKGETIPKNTETNGSVDEGIGNERQQYGGQKENDEVEKEVTDENHEEPVNTPNNEELKTDNSVPSESSQSDTINRDTEASEHSDEEREIKRQQSKDQNENEKDVKDLTDENFRESEESAHSDSKISDKDSGDDSKQKEEEENGEGKTPSTGEIPSKSSDDGESNTEKSADAEKTERDKYCDPEDYEKRKKKDNRHTNNPHFVECEACYDNNDAFWRCVNCEGNLCRKCHKQHTTVKLTRHHTIKLIERPDRCPKHLGRRVCIFCENCQVDTCGRCQLDDHKGHSFIGLLEKDQREMRETDPCVRGHGYTTRLDAQLEIADARIDFLHEKMEFTRNDMKDIIDKLYTTIDIVYNRMIGKLEEKSRAERGLLVPDYKSLESQRAVIERTINDCRQRMGQPRLGSLDLIKALGINIPNIEKYIPNLPPSP